MSERTDASPDAPRSDLQVVARVAALLRLFGPERPRIRMSEAAESLELRRTTVHRYLNSLEHHGFLKRVDGANYELGPLVDQLGVLSSTRWRLMEAAAPLMEELAGSLRQTVVLSIWNGGAPVVTRVSEDTTQSVHISVRVGSTLPVDSAQGTVFLSQMRGSHAYARARKGLSAKERAKLDEGLAAIERTGAAVSETVVLGVRSVAVPVLGDGGAIEAALAVVGPHGTVPADPASPVALALVEAGRQLSELISGGSAQQPGADWNTRRRNDV